MEEFIMGAIASASGIVALFFLRFWRDTGDRLFALFSLAFALLGSTRLALVLLRDNVEPLTYIYWVRLTAFLIILAAIVDKNRR
jgi:hypothetical protein